MAEDREGQSWLSGAVVSLFGVSHQQKGNLPHQCTECEKGKQENLRSYSCIPAATLHRVYLENVPDLEVATK